MTENSEESIWFFFVVIICLIAVIGLTVDTIQRVNDYKRVMMVLKRDFEECTDEEERHYIKKEIKRLWLAYLPFVGKWFV